MIERIFGPVVIWTTDFISQIGYTAILICMTIESACIPLPSEIIMPFSGYLVSTGRFNLHLAVFAGALGNLIGGIITYLIGKSGGRPFFERHGKYFLITKKDLKQADLWFERFGEWSIFITRNMPIIRTFISLPAGVAKMNFLKFSIFTFFGSIPWCYFLTLVGKTFGEHWEDIRVYFRKADIFIAVVLVFLFGIWIYRHLIYKESRE